MKVAHIQQEFYPALGGGPLSIYRSLKDLASKGLEITAYTTNIVDINKKTRIKAGIEHQKNLKIVRHNALQLHRHFTLDPSLILSLLREKTSILHAHGFGYPSSEIASLASQIKGVPFVLSTHGFFPVTMNVNPFLAETYVRIAERTILANAAAVIVDTSDERKIYSKLCDPSKIRQIPLGTISADMVGVIQDDSEFRKLYNVNDPYFLSIGRITEAKGFQNLLRSIPEFVKNFGVANVKFVIIGPDGGFLEQLKKLSLILGVEHHVIFAGPVSDNIKYSAISGTIALVLPSFYETYGLVITEAMAQGKPVIATKYGGAKELIKQGYNGIAVDPKSTEELCRALNWAYELNEERRNSIFRYSTELLLNGYTIEASSRKLIDLYSNLVLH